MIYTQGTLSTVSGSAIVRGTGTKFKDNLNGIAPGQVILIQSGSSNLLHMIQAVNSDTELILADNVNVTLNNVVYQIQVTVPDSMSDGVRHMVAINTYIVQFLQNMDQWMTQNGTVAVTLPNGQTVSLQSIKAMNDALAGKLDKRQNGADIPNKTEFVRNIGLNNALKTGEYGIGSQPIGISAPSKYDANEAITTGWYGGGGSGAKNFWAAYGPVMVMARTGGDGSGSVAQFQVSDAAMANRVREGNKWSAWNIAWCTGNTTVIDGFIKKASPIIKIWGDGKFKTNDESEGAIVERLSEGVYLNKNVLGFNADAAWGGVDGGIEIPICKNKLSLIWVNYEVLPDGAIKLMTCHREHQNAPEFARNVRQGYSDGDLIDIPVGRSIAVRVQMPENSVWNVKQKAAGVATDSDQTEPVE
ncbi:hypothetical protein [Xenorhabdus sp. PB30.3]|uniref:phage tail fiber protein n=1 Tax=Xenorhabdus sp. PB30.3 TaxID=2788941 RepID=UPI001E5E7BED|nr:hypothetical protein [Xenorhabdus sp. PB30.3]MCC8381844.1 hypothetical protein [Xenorhabdus sp. PB30.3]